eukprot:6207558-Pleurochrysis_carterae.AAC.1
MYACERGPGRAATVSSSVARDEVKKHYNYAYNSLLTISPSGPRVLAVCTPFTWRTDVSRRVMPTRCAPVARQSSELACYCYQYPSVLDLFTISASSALCAPVAAPTHPTEPGSLSPPRPLAAVTCAACARASVARAGRARAVRAPGARAPRHDQPSRCPRK